MDDTAGVGRSVYAPEAKALAGTDTRRRLRTKSAGVRVTINV